MKGQWQIQGRDPPSPPPSPTYLWTKAEAEAPKTVKGPNIFESADLH